MARCLRWTAARQAAHAVSSMATTAVFALLDILDALLCYIYALLDALFEGKAGSTISTAKGSRWSDCNCERCVSWEREDRRKLHVVAEKSALHPLEAEAEAVIFWHGFLSSSSLWIETVFPNLSESAKANYRFFAVDLLGFGDSPKPRDSLYRLEDHVEMIERSVIQQFNLDSFHLVAHSMGCIIALALASKHPRTTKSVTLVAPPYFPASSEEKASQIMANRLAGKRIWPFPSFGSAVMTWYEHVGRTVCFIGCRNHRTWEQAFKFLTRKREVSFLIRDISRHTHHSAWHTMHNVIRKGADHLDSYLQTVRAAGVPMVVFHGMKDEVVPLECSFYIKSAVPFADVRTVPGANHGAVILGREIHFTREIEAIWDASRVRNQDLRT